MALPVRLSLLFALLLSALAVFFGTGLHPVWWVTWLVPLPILWIAPRLSRGAAFGATVLAWALGTLNMADYGLRLVGTPLPLFLAFDILPGCVVGAAVLFYRASVRKGLIWRAPLGFAAIYTTFEFTQSLLSIHGTFGSLAYTQPGLSSRYPTCIRYRHMGHHLLLALDAGGHCRSPPPGGYNGGARFPGRPGLWCVAPEVHAAGDNHGRGWTRFDRPPQKCCSRARGRGGSLVARLCGHGRSPGDARCEPGGLSREVGGSSGNENRSDRLPIRGRRIRAPNGNPRRADP